MDGTEWRDLIDLLRYHLEIIQKWEPDLPDAGALRCEQSRHRTLAHLRACQEQWLPVVTAFIDRDSPSVKILHPWRQFDLGNYAALPWDVHMKRFVEDRQRWLSFRDSVDWNRGGKRNLKSDTIGGLTKHLANHESHHIGLL